MGRVKSEEIDIGAKISLSVGSLYKLIVKEQFFDSFV
jgi:hypothetical protein